MAKDLPETATAGRGGCRRLLCWLRARLLAVVLGFVVAIVFDALMQNSVSFVNGSRGFFINAAQAKKGSQENRREVSRDDNEGERQARSKARR